MALFREWLLAIAVLGLITTAVLEPATRTLSLVFAVVGVGLLIRRRQRRIAANKLSEATQSPTGPAQH